MKLRRNTAWLRDPHNPVLPPIDADERESECCMNPCAVRGADGGIRLYYAGGDSARRRRICLATAAADDPTTWERRGPLIEPGPSGRFDAAWCVLPNVVRDPAGGERVYYTGNSGVGISLARFPGLGLATSADGVTYVKHEGNPLIRPQRADGEPDAQGIAGGSVVRVRRPDGGEQWRYYYTGCPTLGDDVFLDQQKTVCLAVSDDGLAWERRGAVMRRDPSHDYEDIAVAGPVVRQGEDGRYQMWYSAIGTRWGYYSICYAESDDGLTWNRGERYGDNLQMGPTFASGGWEGQMVEYPSVIDEPGGGLRLFYCGNGYGRTGIGTAVSTPLRATHHGETAHVASAQSDAAWELAAPASVRAGGRDLGDGRAGEWAGPDAAGTIWREAALAESVRMRAMIEHIADGLRVRVTLVNEGPRELRDVEVAAASAPLGPTSRALDLSWDEPRRDLPPGATEVWQGQARPPRGQ